MHRGVCLAKALPVAGSITGAAADEDEGGSSSRRKLRAFPAAGCDNFPHKGRGGSNFWRAFAKDR